MSANEEIRDILHHVVVKNSRTKYNNTNIRFILWLYENPVFRVQLISPEYCLKLDQAYERQREYGEKQALRKEVKRMIEAMAPDLDNCPLLLHNLTFDIVSKYCVSRKQTKGTLKKKKRKRKRVEADNAGDADENPNPDDDTLLYYSKGFYETIRSSLAHMFRTAGVRQTDEFKSKMSNFAGGLKRTIAAEKRDQGLKLGEGKDKMDFETYKKMAELLFKAGGADNIFAHCFLVLEWNLMARSDNIVHTTISHMEWQNDSLVFYFAKSKGDQEGVMENEPWHVYANPGNPFICPILALSRYCCCNPSVLAGECKLFESSDPYQRYSKAFERILFANKDLFEGLGVDVYELGSHSVRKGSASRCAAGCTVSPPMASICLRAGWSMGPVKERYIHYEKAGDQFLGRAVTGLDISSEDFTVSPCYFDFSEIKEEEERDRISADIEFSIRNYLSNGRVLQPYVFLICRYLYASLCFHFEFLKLNLDQTDRLRQSPIFQQITDEHVKIARIAFPWDSTRYTPQLTGLPPHSLLLAKMKDVTKMVSRLKEELSGVFRTELNKRDVGGGMHHASAILDEINNKHNEVIGLMKSMATVADGKGTVETTDIFGEEANKNKAPVGTMLHCYGGSLQLLPKGWKMPDMTFCQFICMWLCGDQAKGIPPFRLLKTIHLSNIVPRAKVVLCNMRYLINAVEVAAVEAGVWECDPKMWTKPKVMAMYDKIFSRFKYQAKYKTRFHELSWRTIKNQLYKNKGKLVGGEVNLVTAV